MRHLILYTHYYSCIRHTIFPDLSTQKSGMLTELDLPIVIVGHWPRVHRYWGSLNYWHANKCGHQIVKMGLITRIKWEPFWDSHFWNYLQLYGFYWISTLVELYFILPFACLCTASKSSFVSSPMKSLSLWWLNTGSFVGKVILVKMVNIARIVLEYHETKQF